MITFLIITLIALLIAASLMAWRYYSAAKYWKSCYESASMRYTPSLLSTVETVARIAVMLAVAGSWVAVVRSKFGKPSE